MNIQRYEDLKSFNFCQYQIDFIDSLPDNEVCFYRPLGSDYTAFIKRDAHITYDDFDLLEALLSNTNKFLSDAADVDSVVKSVIIAIKSNAWLVELEIFDALPPVSDLFGPRSQYIYIPFKNCDKDDIIQTIEIIRTGKVRSNDEKVLLPTFDKQQMTSINDYIEAVKLSLV